MSAIPREAVKGEGRLACRRLPTLQNPRLPNPPAAKPIGRRLGACRRIRRRDPTGTEEEDVEDVDGIGEVDLAVAVRVPPEEELIQRRAHVESPEPSAVNAIIAREEERIARVGERRAPIGESKCMTGPPNRF